MARTTWADFDGPWWFANRSDDPAAAGRFDLARPHGTCYFAFEPTAALIERLSDPDELEPVISYDLLQNLTVWQGPLAVDVEAADTTERASRIPLELGVTTPYDVPWQWADALHADGRDGLCWWLRFDPRRSVGVAVFDPASSPDEPPDPGRWPPLERRLPATRWLDELSDLFDIDDVPSFAETDVADDRWIQP